MQACKVEITAVHHIEGAGLGQQVIEHVDVVPFAVADMDEGGDIAAQLQQRMQLDSRFGRAKWCPGKHRQAQVDGSTVERVDSLLQLDTERLVDVEPSRDPDQSLGELGVDAPVSDLIGIGQRREPRNGGT